MEYPASEELSDELSSSDSAVEMDAAPSPVLQKKRGRKKDAAPKPAMKTTQENVKDGPFIVRKTEVGVGKWWGGFGMDLLNGGGPYTMTTVASWEFFCVEPSETLLNLLILARPHQPS